jgi:hypothetical protein
VLGTKLEANMAAGLTVPWILVARNNILEVEQLLRADSFSPKLLFLTTLHQYHHRIAIGR